MILFDLSRLVSRAGRETPTGIDRVELAYAEHLTATNTPLCFTMMTTAGRLGVLPRAAAEQYLRTLAGAWRQHPSSRQIWRTKRLARRLHAEALLRGGRTLRAQRPDKPLYLLVSHHHLEKRRAIAGLKERAGRPLCA